MARERSSNPKDLRRFSLILALAESIGYTGP
jgi:hypothetical protein